MFILFDESWDMGFSQFGSEVKTSGIKENKKKQGDLDDASPSEIIF